MKKALILIALNFIVLTTMAQRISIESIETRLLTNQGVEFVGKVIEEKNDLNLFPTWNNKGILFYNDKEYQISNLNYNISENKVSCQLKNGEYFLFRSADIPSFSINNKLFKKNGRSYFEVLLEEKDTYFYKRYDVRYKDGVKHRMGGGTVNPSRFVISYSYLIKSGDITKTLESNKKSILEFFESQQTVLKKFVKDNKLSYKKENDLVKIIRYMLKKANQLV
ncbi:MAG: hypothetical protein COA67_01765 [Lutibacter sp.]|nr:MAG: hypothetical protein COA67_01765 [Lutibacter sp.]